MSSILLLAILALIFNTDPALAFPVGDTVRARWLCAAASSDDAAAQSIPIWKPFAELRGMEKWELLHGVAASVAGYITPYGEKTIDQLSVAEASIEHVLPCSRVNGERPGAAEDDPHGWVEVSSSMKELRGELPLALWPFADDSEAAAASVVEIHGEPHFLPPLSQRARLARKASAQLRKWVSRSLPATYTYKLQFSTLAARSGCIFDTLTHSRARLHPRASLKSSDLKISSSL